MVYAQEVGAWGRMAARQQRVEEAQLPAVDEVEQVRIATGLDFPSA